MTEWAFADVWEAVAEARGASPALVHGDHRTSWSEFSQRADAIAAFLIGSGVMHQDKVANYLFNGPEYLEALFAALKAGLVPVNTNYRYGSDELRYLWTNADAAAVVFDATFTEVVEQIRAELPTVRVWLCVTRGTHWCPTWAVPYEEVASRPVPAPTRAPWGRSPDDRLFVYTGGTTGLPKGVMWRQGTLGRSSASAHAPATLAEVGDALPGTPPVLLPACPLMHATGLFIAFGTLRQGGCVVTLTSPNLDVVELLDTIERERVASMAIVGDVFARPILSALDAEPGRWDLSSLRTIISSGVMWSAPVKQRLLKHQPSLLLFDSLGSSEAVGLGQSISSSQGVTGTADFRLGDHTRVVTDMGQDVVPGSGDVGRLARAGMIPDGYYKDEAKTAATFRTIDGIRYVLPGDLATVRSDGTVVLLGRGSQCINTGGEKVFPEEVEEVLKEHDAIADAAVVGVPHDTWGEAVCAMVEPRPGAIVREADAIAYVRTRLAHFKAPKRVLAVTSLGRAPNGKLDYQGLRAHAMEVLIGTRCAGDDDHGE